MKYHLIIRCDAEHIVHPPRSLEWIFGHVRKLVMQGYHWTRTDICHDDGLVEVWLTDPDAPGALQMPLEQEEIFAGGLDFPKNSIIFSMNDSEGCEATTKNL